MEGKKYDYYRSAVNNLREALSDLCVIIDDLSTVTDDDTQFWIPNNDVERAKDLKVAREDLRKVLAYLEMYCKEK
jgi:hypothetical protein